MFLDNFDLRIYQFQVTIIFNYLLFYRYHGDERLLPEYDPTMSDNVRVVEEPQSSSSSMADSEKTPFFPEETRDYFVDEDFLVDTRSMYLATLKLNRVKPEQKGKYKCGPSNTQSASVELHITDGE